MFLGIFDGVTVYHSLESDLLDVLRYCLEGKAVVVAHGPLYDKDPAEDLLLPFMRSAEQALYTSLKDDELLPPRMYTDALTLRCESARSGIYCNGVDESIHWTRAGAILQLGCAYGIPVRGAGILHPKLKMRGTVTGRFGYESAFLPGGTRFNPMTISFDDRRMVVPSKGDREVAVLDFKGMDICSMLAIVPTMKEHYGDYDDPHHRTGQILFGNDDEAAERREEVKKETFVFAYGGKTPLEALFNEKLPELHYLRHREQGEAGRMVQSRSARTFRIALSASLNNLMNEDCRPMFAVHDELVMDCKGMALPSATRAIMEEHATKITGVRHTVTLKSGPTYFDAKCP